MPRFESSAAQPLSKSEKPKLTVIEGGKGKKKDPERWSADELMKPSMPKPRAHGAEKPIDVAAVMREDEQKQEDIRRKISQLDMPKPKAVGRSDERWSADDLLKPNMPKPRAHGAEAPVDIGAVMRSEAGPKPKKEKPNIVLPKPRGYEEPMELGDEDIEILEEEAPSSKRPPTRRPPPPQYREAA